MAAKAKWRGKKMATEGRILRGKQGRRPSPRQERFVLEYMVDLNATQATIRAGYKAANANVVGPRLLTHPNVAAAIAKAAEKIAKKTGITSERVLVEAAALAFSDISNYIQDEHGYLALAPGAPADAMRAVASVKYRTFTTGSGKDVRITRECEFKLWDKPGMVKLAGKHVDVHGFADRVELTGKNGRPVEVEAKVTIYKIPDNCRNAS